MLPGPKASPILGLILSLHLVSVFEEVKRDRCYKACRKDAKDANLSFIRWVPLELRLSNLAHVSIILETVLNPDVPSHSSSIRSERQEVGPRMTFQEGSQTDLFLLAETSFPSILFKDLQVIAKCSEADNY